VETRWETAMGGADWKSMAALTGVEKGFKIRERSTKKGEEVMHPEACSLSRGCRTCSYEFLLSQDERRETQ